jgi:GNAT superfamily N-acetyltransferase
MRYKDIMRLIDVHIHVGHRFEWTDPAKKVWMDTGPYVPRIFDKKERQLSQEYGDAIKKEGVFGGILIPEYSPLTAGVMPFERAKEIHSLHPELIPIANINPNYNLPSSTVQPEFEYSLQAGKKASDIMDAFEDQLKAGARGLKIHPIHGFFYANDPRLYPLYDRCEQEGLPVMFHAGTSLFKGVKMRYADPYTFDDVISDFPNLKIVLCHGGRGFWYNIAEFLVKSFQNVYIDISGLPPKNLLTYWPSMKRFNHKFLFGTDFPGVPGIQKNYDAVSDLIRDTRAMENIGFNNAYDLFGFWKEGIFEIKDENEIFAVVDDASKKYKGLIPEDRYHEPYMPVEEVRTEMKRMRFYGYRKDLKLLGVMARERIKDVTLIRHAYVLREYQGQGIGSKLLAFLEEGVDTKWLLIGTWKAATWAIDFYREHGFTLMDDKEELLRAYWDIPDRQIETSCVLGKKI